MTLGEKIKELRQKNNVTQEKLAEYLNITCQSISKWENNNALPDISLVIPLANFFGISLDELFGRNEELQEDEIRKYKERALKLANQGLIAEEIAVWREASQKYPRNYHCLIELASALWQTLNRPDKFKDSHEQNAGEVITICQRILKDCSDNKIREEALQLLVYTYANASLSFADETKAVEYAKMSGSLFTCSEFLLEQAYCTEEGEKEALKQRQINSLYLMDMLCLNITYALYQTPEEEIFAYETAIKLWSTFLYDGNFLFYHSHIADIYRRLAQKHALLGNRKQTLENLQKALFHAHQYDNLPKKEQHFTSIWVSEATSDPSHSAKNYTETDTELIQAYMSNTCYDFIRDDPNFTALLEK